ncbi:MAG: PASTA domain-containing protein [Saprospiraceae bacterium]|nr:PASTA domain-containing protein [Saprospiraceae bacterium]MCB9321171.1 PASTA domain-containing protein [Lewinellaceae bacterium]
MAKKLQPSDNTSSSFQSYWAIMTSRSCLKQLGLIVAFLLAMLLLVFGWLKIYTRHGQKLELPDYTEMSLLDAEKDAKHRDFEIVVSDSVHIVEKPGGIILQQNPAPHSLVKKDRKVYVTVTKYKPDKINLEDLGKLYGNAFNSIQDMLKGYHIQARIRDYRYDPFGENIILEVWYNGQVIVNKEGVRANTQIDKGGTLEFILSKSNDAVVKTPKLVCLTYAESIFITKGYQLALKMDKEYEYAPEDLDNAYVYKQYPSPDSRILMGDTVIVYLTTIKPADCDEGFIQDQQ